MKSRALLVLALFVLSATALPAAVAAPPRADRVPLLALSGTERAERLGAIEQPSASEADRAVSAASTEAPVCDPEDDRAPLVLRLPSLDPNTFEEQDVVFFPETPEDAPGLARIWVAWDYRQSAWADAPDPISCEQVAYLQQAADEIIDTDVHYFGDYEARGNGGKQMDIFVYNIVDVRYYDPTFESYIAGFYSSYLEETLDRNLFFLDTYGWNLSLGPDAKYPNEIEGIFAHEFVHLIQWDHDGDEETWIKEGLADLAMYLTGYDGGNDGQIIYYLLFHRDSLTRWGGALEDYGAAYLFQLYLLENFGERDGEGVWDNGWTRAFMDLPADGTLGVEEMTGRDFDVLFDAWIMANLQDTPEVAAAGGLPMGYDLIDLNPFVSRYGAYSIRTGIDLVYGARSAGNLPISRYYGGYLSGTVELPVGAVAPYAPVYRSFQGAQPGLNVYFRGESVSGVAPTAGVNEAFSGTGNDLVDRRLLLESPVAGGSTLTFKAWWDIEEDWDFGFVEASTDGGETWTAIPGSITRTSTNPYGSTAWSAALGAATSTDAAITGASDGWEDAEFVLPEGEDVLVRFNYYTDEYYNGAGWFIDEIAVDGISESFEGDLGAWDLGGWQIGSLLFDNDWVVAWANPSKGGSWATGYVPAIPNGAGRDVATTFLPTLSLGSGEVIVVFANRPRDVAAFDGSYTSLVGKRF